MKYVTLIFWALILGEVLGYIGSSLEMVTFQPGPVAIWATIVGTIGAVVVAKISESASNPKQD